MQKTDSIRWRIGARWGRVGLVAAGWAHDRGAELGDGVRRTRGRRSPCRRRSSRRRGGAGKQRQRDLAFGAVGADQRGGAWGAVGRAGQVQAHAPKPARVAARVAVAAALGQLGAARRLERAAALDRCRVEQHAGRRAPGSAAANTPISHSIVSASRARRLCNASWLGKQREQMRELAPGGAQEAAVARDAHQHLSDTQRHDLRVGQLAAARYAAAAAADRPPCSRH